jgi:hypothetical protein
MSSYRSATLTTTAAICAGLAFALGAGAAAAEDGAVRDRTIGFVLTNKSFAVWTSPGGKTECPQGYNHGPREQFKALYPEGGEFTDTLLEREGEIVFPDTGPEPKLFFREPVAKTGLGLNLDGKTDANDFTSPEGLQGIDNQMYRVVGCTESYRGPDGSARFFIEDYMQKFNYNRWLIEVTNVDDLTNDPDVTINLYRGLDDLTKDAAGNYTSGGSQRVDDRWGREFKYSMKGKIEGGVLTNTPTDITFPESQRRGFPYQSVRDWRLQLSITAEGAEGLMAGYLDAERWHRGLWQQWSTHHRSYGAESLPSQYRSLRRNADAYPNEKGENTHISTAWAIKFSQAFILHPPRGVAGAEQPQPASATTAPARE